MPLTLLDLGAVFFAYLLPLVVRFEGAVPDRYWRNFLRFIPLIALLHLAANASLGLYGQMWRYASVQEARRVVAAGVTTGGVIVGAWALLGARSRPLPLSVIVLGASLSLMAFGAIRFQSRLFGFHRRVVGDRTRVLLVGAGDAGAMVLKDILANPSLGLDPVALVDDDRRKTGLQIHGVSVVGSKADIPSLITRLGIDQVLLAVPSASSEVVRDVAALCEEADVALRVLPSVREVVGGRVTARDIRDLSIEDLLGRQQVDMDLEAVTSILRGRRVLVTGAGGSIGSEIVRQVASLGPASLVLLDHDETHLHDALLESGTDGVEAVLADIRDRERIVAVFAEHRPDIVFHAAAHKHVPILERHPEEALLTNVIGTANTVDAALMAGTGRFVLISTDKAIRPANVMGASKWLAEQIARSLHGSGCIFCAVRFGNVLGSRGSVVPTFLRQIARGGPVTVTDPAMARYFMSVHEAVQLVLQAAALSRGGEVFTLDMGEPMNILELARKLIRFSGHVPEKDVEISVIGPRPGEKAVEDIIDLGEEQLASGHPSISVARPVLPDPAGLRSAIWELEGLAREGRRDELGERMKELAAGSLRPLQVVVAP